jgi:hypothetical protein
MKRIRIVGLCLAAIFAFAAIVASGASAESPPEVGRCLKKAGGKWKNSTCTTAAKPGEEKFEWYPAFVGGVPNPTPNTPKLKYTSENKPEAVIQLESVSGAVIKATSQKATGEVTGPKTNIAQNIVFGGVEFKGFKCTSTNPKGATNEVKVKDLDGLIGLEKKGETAVKDKVANRFVPKEGGKGAIFTEFTCGVIPIIVRGAVLNPVSANKMLGFPKAAVVKFAGAKGKQKPEKFLGSSEKEVLESSIEGGPFEQSDQVLTTLQLNEEKLEISTLE